MKLSMHQAKHTVPVSMGRSALLVRLHGGATTTLVYGST
jgi:hypothetical protein